MNRKSKARSICHSDREGQPYFASLGLKKVDFLSCIRYLSWFSRRSEFQLASNYPALAHWQVSTKAHSYSNSCGRFSLVFCAFGVATPGPVSLCPVIGICGCHIDGDPGSSTAAFQTYNPIQVSTETTLPAPVSPAPSSYPPS